MTIHPLKPVDEWSSYLGSMPQHLPTFKPRQFILEHMTDEHSARLLLKSAHGEDSGV
jgi:hypothetical protein